MLKYKGVEVLFTTFPNGETKFHHESIQEVLNVETDNSVGFIDFKYESDKDLIKLLFLKNYLEENEYEVEHFLLNIHYMPYSRMDRSEGGSAFTLKYIADFINSMNFSAVYLNEPHSAVSSDLIWKSHSFFTSVDVAERAKMEINFSEDTDSIMFPDKGAKNRYENHIDAKHIVIGEKTRDFVSGRITGLELTGDLDGSGYKALIIDDLTSYGGTFVKSAKALRAKGFKEVYLAVTHAEDVIFDGELFDHIDHLFTTDSILTKHNDLENEKFKDKLTVYQMGEF